MEFSWKGYLTEFKSKWREQLYWGLSIWLITGLGIWLISELIAGLIVGLIIGLSLGLYWGLLRGLLGELGTNEIEIKEIPNQGIRLSIKNALWLWLIVGLGAGLIVGLIVGVPNLILGLQPRLVVGRPIFGLYFGLRYGGLTAFQHYTLRFVLASKGDIPWTLVHFLNYATDRIFVRKVGGGYIFIHRLLMEHFANLKTAQIQKILSATKN